MAGPWQLSTQAVLGRVPTRRVAHPALRTARGVISRWSLVFAGLLRQPLTAAMVLALAVTSATMAGTASIDADSMTLAASTNLPNLLARPLQVLFASAFWVPSSGLFWPLAALLVLVVGMAEQRLGRARTALLFVLGHVGATLVTLTAVSVAVAHGWLPAALDVAVDVGPSYGIAAVGAALIVRTTSRRRGVAVVLLLVGLTAAVAIDRSPTDAGHLMAALLGLVTARPLLVCRNALSLVTGSADAPDNRAADGCLSDHHRGGHDREGDTMNDANTTPAQRTGRWAGVAGLVAAGAVTGGLLMGASNANAATNTAPTPSASSSSSSSGNSSTQSNRATYPAHGTAAHEALEKPVTGSNATQAQAAAVKAVGSGTAGAVTTDVSGSGYEVTVTKSDGSQVEVHLNGSFAVNDQGPLSGQ